MFHRFEPEDTVGALGEESVVPFRATGRHDRAGRLRVSWIAPRLVLLALVATIVLIGVTVVVALAWILDALMPGPEPLNAAKDAPAGVTSSSAPVAAKGPADVTVTVPVPSTVVKPVPVTSTTVAPAEDVEDAPVEPGDPSGRPVAITDEVITVDPPPIVLKLPLLDVSLDVGLEVPNPLGALNPPATTTTGPGLPP